MKKILLIPLLLLVSLPVFGQIQIFQSTVSDAETGEALAGVNIYDQSTGAGTITDINGKFGLKAEPSDQIVIHFLGYEDQKYKASELPGNIKLKPKTDQLQQVVITASKERQQRTQVPVAITQISPVELEQTNPINLEEIINKVPGVMMVDLGNEQHSMAIRQPISYKSVYLYLEDGLPIRATGVFNHNALIEINRAALKSVEVIRGPYSALYGSDAIGGAINFITKDPTALPLYKFYGATNNLGYSKAGVLASNTFGNTGMLGILEYSGRKNGYREHSDYDKASFFFKMKNKIGDKAYLKTSINFIDYKTDMTGGLDSLHFYTKDYVSQYTFTYRKVKALRYYTQLDYRLNEHNRMKAMVFGRYNDVAQNPHYRIKDIRGTSDRAKGEINDNKFWSLGTVIQDQYTDGNLKLIMGLSLDYSPNSYESYFIEVHKTDDGIYDAYVATDSLLSWYDVNLLNVGYYTSVAYKFSDYFKLLGAFRYDNINYDFKNYLDASAYSGALDSKNSFNAFTPRVGFIVKVAPELRFYANYSKGFRPPEVGELYRGVKVPVLEPVYYDNYEGGTWISLFDNHLNLDWAYYYLKAENEIISVRLPDGSRENQNAAETGHKGLEFSIQYLLSPEWSVRLNGAKSQHKFLVYKPKQNQDYSGNIMPGAPEWVMNGELKYQPSFWKDSYFIIEWFRVSPYYMDLDNTMKYNGYHIFNLRTGKKFGNFKLWFNVLNLTDKLYATSASYSWGRQSFRPGEKRSFNVGMTYIIK